MGRNPVETHFHRRLHAQDPDALYVSCLFMACDGRRLIAEGVFAPSADSVAGSDILNGVIGGLSANADAKDAAACATEAALVDLLRGRIAALRWPAALAVATSAQGDEGDAEAAPEDEDQPAAMLTDFPARMRIGADEAAVQIAAAIFRDESVAVSAPELRRVSLLESFRGADALIVGAFLGFGSAAPTPWLAIVLADGVFLLGGCIGLSHALHNGMYDRLLRLFGGAATPAEAGAAPAEAAPETEAEREKRTRLIAEAGFIRYDKDGQIVDISETKLREVDDE